MQLSAKFTSSITFRGVFHYNSSVPNRRQRVFLYPIYFVYHNEIATQSPLGQDTHYTRTIVMRIFAVPIVVPNMWELFHSVRPVLRMRDVQFDNINDFKQFCRQFVFKAVGPKAVSGSGDAHST